MKTDHILIGIGVITGLVIGAVVTARPELKTFDLPPYVGVLLAMAIFEGVLFWRSGGNPAVMPSLWARLAAFAVGAG